MQYQHTKREPEMAELIEGSERDRRRLAELLDGIRVGPGVDAMADGMREAVWADVRSRIRRRGIRMRIVRCAAATRRLSVRRPPMNQLPQTTPAITAAAAA